MEIITNNINIELLNFNQNNRLFRIKINRSSNKSIWSDIPKLIRTIDTNKVKSLYRKSPLIIYVLFDKYSEFTKDIFKGDFLDIFEKKHGMIDLPIDEYNLNMKDYKSIVANLLLCSLSQTTSLNEKDDLRFGSVDGELYEYVKSKGNQIVTLNYKIDEGYLISTIKTFTEVLVPTKETTYNLNKDFLVKGKNENQQYILKGDKNKKNNVSFFASSSYEAFKNSKMVRLNRIKELFNETFDGQCKIEFKKREVNEIKFESTSSKNKSYLDSFIKKIKDKKIKIIDYVEDMELLDTICRYLKYNDYEFEVSNHIDSESYNLCIIHDAKYYEENQLEDKHNKRSDAVVQHLTYENFVSSIGTDYSESFSLKFQVILVEMQMKYEIVNRKIGLYKTNNIILNNYIFGEIKKHGNEYYDYQLSYDKQMIFNSNKIENKDNHKLKEIIYLKKKHDKSGVIHVITDSNGYAIVDTNQLDELFKYYRKDMDIKNNLYPFMKSIKIDKYSNEIKEILRICLRETVNTLENINAILRSYKKDCDVEARKTWYKALKAFNREMFIKSGGKYFLKPIFRGKEGSYSKTFTNCKYWTSGKNLFYYSAACKSISEDISRGFPIKYVSNIDLSIDEIDEYLDLLDIDVIRKNQTTVIPYPFKYLREYINMKK